LNWDIVDAMSTVKELMLSPDGIVLEPLEVVVDDDDDDDDDEQPADARATTASVTRLTRRKRRNVPWPREWEGRPPSLLLPSLISPIPLSHGRHPNNRDAGHHTAGASLQEES
jgi:hypothetical protein